MKKHVEESMKRIPKNIGNLTEGEEPISILDEEDNVKDLVDMIEITNKAFYKGNGNVGVYDSSPEEILREYGSFD
jgi:hypothetical protein